VQTYKLPNLATARLWTSACPTDPGRSYGGCAIEISIPHGGRCAYGLLGASLSSDEREDPCRVLVPENGEPWHGSLVEVIEVVDTGLPAEYADAVKLGGQAALSSARSALRLDYDCACHGRVGSSPALFGQLAAAVVQVHADRTILEDEERLRSVLEEVRLYWRP